MTDSFIRIPPADIADYVPVAGLHCPKCQAEILIKHVWTIDNAKPVVRFPWYPLCSCAEDTIREQIVNYGKRCNSAVKGLVEAHSLDADHPELWAQIEMLLFSRHQVPLGSLRRLSPIQIERILNTTKIVAKTTIDRLRLECGWSLDEFVDKSEVDKKTVRNWCNNAEVRIRPFHRKKLSRIFTAGLGREVTVEEVSQKLY